MPDYQEIIESNADVRFGKPCVRGTRISVYDILGWLASGMTFDEILVDYPSLKKADLFACLQYAADKERKVKLIA